jgi:hypothetical protein
MKRHSLVTKTPIAKEYRAVRNSSTSFPDFDIHSSDGVKLQAHRIVLAGKYFGVFGEDITWTKFIYKEKLTFSDLSPVFAAMLATDMVEKSTQTVNIADFNSTTIDMALDYMYAGYLKSKCTVDYEQLMEVAAFGQMYEVRGLVKAAFEQLFLQTNVNNVLDIINNVEMKNFQDAELRSNLIRYTLL